MRIGVLYPQRELPRDPQALVDFACSVEELGFDYLVLNDHVVGAVGEDRDPPLTGPYRETDPFHDPLVAFAHLSALTTTLEFCTGVMILPQRQTVLVARQTADLDLLSGGRFSLGVGVGWNPVEYEALGTDFGTRGDRLTEQIDLLRRLWSGEVVDFQGMHHRVDHAALVPAPASGIPILCGGMSAAAYRRAAKHADGFIFMGALHAITLPAWRELRESMKRADRDVEGFRAEYYATRADFGGLRTSDLLSELETWEANGGTHACVKTMGMGLSTVSAHLQHLEIVAASLCHR
ncbi:LLM class F420-dependent oxidoreductase [Williamsia sp. D3]|uniref:LLM class F420-dependent oxidoreductase n=1 Tax=Williamsia sp. D3 TaxID=1313067 RepID=UPI0003D37987|nr:LLM class F420-dependent oxidoreductase [Williamsia sp. D3]ETD33298.1 monooxygenase [Williamsia sp. D3]